MAGTHIANAFCMIGMILVGVFYHHYLGTVPNREQGSPVSWGWAVFCSLQSCSNLQFVRRDTYPQIRFIVAKTHWLGHFYSAKIMAEEREET